jgi:hypothetical protein
MSNTHTDEEPRGGIKDICLQVGVWGVLVVGFLTVCIAVPMLALNI